MKTIDGQASSVCRRSTKAASIFPLQLIIMTHRRVFFQQVEGKTKKTFLADWGMANIRETVRNKMEKSKKIGPIGGTLLYKAPECVLEDQIPPTKMSDIWSVGATFLEVFTQKKPWTTCNGMLKNMFNKELPKSFAALTKKLQPIVKECFSYEPKERPTASRMVSAIKSMEGVDLVKHYGYTF